MNRSWILILICIVAAGLSACAGQNPSPTTVVLTPAGESATIMPAETPQVELEFVTPEKADRQPPVDSPTRLPPPDPEITTADSWFSISPDGAWTAQVQVVYPIDKNGVKTGEKYYVRLEVLKQNGSLRWTVLDEWSTWGMGYTIPANLHWRKDSARLFYSLQAAADGCAVFGHESGLYEVNLEDGSVRELSSNAYGELKAAPDGKRIAVLSENVLSVRTLSSAETVEANLKFLGDDWQAGKLLWSPDEKSIVFTVIFRPCGPPESSSIYRLDVETMILTGMIKKDTRKFVASQWLPDGQIELLDEGGVKWRLNPATRVVEKSE